MLLPKGLSLFMKELVRTCCEGYIFLSMDKLKCGAIHLNDAVTHISKSYFEYISVYLRMQYTKT